MYVCECRQAGLTLSGQGGGKECRKERFESGFKDGRTFLYLLSDKNVNGKNWNYCKEVHLNYIMTEFCYYVASISLIQQGKYT